MFVGTRWFCEILLFVGQGDSLSCKEKTDMRKGQNVPTCRPTSGKQRANNGNVIFIRCGTVKGRGTCARRNQLRNEIVKVCNVRLTGGCRPKEF